MLLHHVLTRINREINITTFELTWATPSTVFPIILPTEEWDSCEGSDKSIGWREGEDRSGNVANGNEGSNCEDIVIA